MSTNILTVLICKTDYRWVHTAFFLQVRVIRGYIFFWRPLSNFERSVFFIKLEIPSCVWTRSHNHIRHRWKKTYLQIRTCKANAVWMHRRKSHVMTCHWLLKHGRYKIVKVNDLGGNFSGCLKFKMPYSIFIRMKYLLTRMSWKKRYHDLYSREQSLH